jgi:drug/metabolite transporter (DMT)-like permease
MPSPPPGRTAALTAAALVAFASNSILCRLALGSRLIDAASFTGARLASGAIALVLLTGFLRGRPPVIRRDWLSPIALFAYAAPFSFAYLRLPAGTGALILFGGVQATMIGWGLRRGERPRASEWTGFFLAVVGLVALTTPGATAPDPLGALLMLAAGAAWGIYSLKGSGAGDPLAVTAGNFARALPLAAILLLVLRPTAMPTPEGIGLALASGAVASGVGYAVWYAALRGLTATRAAIVQLTVPVLAAAAGVVLLGETVSLRLVASGSVILGGIALAVRPPSASGASASPADAMD